EVKDIRWIRTDGTDMTEEEWNTSFVRSLGVLLNGQVMDEVDERGNVIKNGIYLMMVNAYWEGVEYQLPDNHPGEWQLLLDTARPEESFALSSVDGNSYIVAPRSFVMLKLRTT